MPYVQSVEIVELLGTQRPGVLSRSVHTEETTFISEENLVLELTDSLLPQLFADPSNFRIEPFGQVDDKSVMVIYRGGERYCLLWFGFNPERLVRDGGVHVSGRGGKVWQSYARYSNGTYQCTAARISPLEDAAPIAGV